MTAESNLDAPPSGSPGYEIFILALSILSIVNILLILLPIFSGPERTVIEGVDTALCIVFLGDFAFRMSKARHRRVFFLHQHGWLDLIGSLPFPGLRVARAFRILRASEMLKTKGPRQVWHEIISGRAGSALYMAIFLVVLVLEFGGIAVLIAEGRSPDSNIKTGSDALWWAYVTVTTVGYGDRYPVTNWGRFVGVLVMTVGVGLFGVLTGFLANAFVAPSSESTPPPEDARLDTILARLEAIEHLLSTSDQAGSSTVQSSLDTPDTQPLDPGVNQIRTNRSGKNDYQQHEQMNRQVGEPGPASSAI
jgi:voltage-gated potassium channel